MENILLSYIYLPLLSVLSLTVTIFNLFDLDFKKKNFIYTMLSLFISTNLVNHFFGNNLLIKLSSILFLIIITNIFINKETIIRSIITSIISYMFYLLMDFFVFALQHFFFNITDFSLTFNIIYSSILCISILLVNYLLKTISFSLRIKDKYKGNLFWISYLSSAFLVITLSINAYFDKNYSSLIVYIVGIVLLFFILNIFFSKFNNDLLTKELELKNKELEIGQYIEYSDTISPLIDNYQRERHSFKNLMISLNGYIEDGDINGLKKFVNDNFNNNKLFSIDLKNKYFELDKIKIKSLKGLLLTKIGIYNEKTGKDVIVNINNHLKLEDLNIKEKDIVNIIGVLLDNAIEESMNLNYPEILISMNKPGENVELTITNKFKECPDIQKIFKKGYSTKGPNRGIGLYDIKKIIDDDYSHILLETEIEDNFFSQKIIFVKNYTS